MLFLARILLVSFFGSFSESHVLLSPRGSYTWSDAYDNCKANDGYLASDIGYNSTVDSQKSSSAWVGKVELTSKWLQIMGCFIFNTTRGNIFQVPTIAFCEMQCSSFRYFAFRAHIEPVCLCMSQLPTQYSNAYSCESVQTYRFLIVYSRYLRSKSYENAIGNCMYSSCTTSPMQIDGPYVANCTSSSVRGVCGLGDIVEDKNIGWNNSLNECIEHYGTYFPEDFRKVCSQVALPSWTNIFRQNRSFFYTISSNNDELSHRIPLKCASINIDSPYGSKVVNDKVLLTHFVSCNTRLPYFLCVTDSPQLIVSYSSSIMSTVANQNSDNANKSIPTTNEKDVKNKSNTGGIIGGVVCGLIVLVVISIVLIIFKKRSVSMCWMKGDVSVTEQFSNNASASDAEVGLDNNDAIENPTTRIHFSSENHENNRCENSSDHEIVDNTDLSRTHESGSDFIGSINNTQDGKKRAASIDFSSDFLEHG